MIVAVMVVAMTLVRVSFAAALASLGVVWLGSLGGRFRMRVVMRLLDRYPPHEGEPGDDEKGDSGPR
ncbi:MAG: hypothetical protein HONBIEJF_01645 [Fimbriimonadaceae bacterium]|nr:hypothetical protein [Fimbriimonadaceae bacterium]